MIVRAGAIIGFFIVMFCVVDVRAQASKIPDWILKEKFLRACEYGDVEAVKSYLKRGISPNSRDPFDQTALIRTVRGFDIFRKTNETIKVLVDAGADINGANGFGYTPLFISWRHRTIDKNPYDYLLSLGADKNKRDRDGILLEEREYYDNRAKDQFASDMIWRMTLSKEIGWHLAWDRVLKVPRYLNSTTLNMAAAYYGIRFGNKGDWLAPEWQMAVDGNGENYLFYLASHPKVSLEDIVYVDNKAANVANKDRETPLIRAARFDNGFLVKGLLRNGAKADSRDNTGRSALDYSVEYDYFESTFILLAVADANYLNEDGRTPLMTAAAADNRNALKAFLVASQFAAAAPNGSKKLSARDRKEMLSIAARLRKIDHNVQDKDGKTALMLAAEKGNAEAVESLLLMKVNRSLNDKRGKTALALASENGHSTIVKLLSRR